jgi:hypothetical protein
VADRLFKGEEAVLHVMGDQIASEKRRNPWTSTLAWTDDLGFSSERHHCHTPGPGIIRHQPPRRSPNLNAFVERFEGTVLHACYRTAFFRFYASAGDIDAALPA